MAPKRGFLSWDVDGFLASQRRDLFFVPIAITYERLDRRGFDARRALGRGQEGREHARPGAGAEGAAPPLGQRPHQLRRTDLAGRFDRRSRRARFALEATEADAAEKRRFVDDLAQRVVERINAATFANATAVAACAFLGETRRGMMRHELTRRMQEIVDLLRLQDARLTPALLRDQPGLRRSDRVPGAQRSGRVEARPARRDPLLRGWQAPRSRHLPKRRSCTSSRRRASSRGAFSRGASVDVLREDLALLARPLPQRTVHAAPAGAGRPLRGVPRLLRATRGGRATRRSTGAPARRA